MRPDLHDPPPDDLPPPGLPGMRPVRPGDWLRADGDYAGAMRLRARLLGAHRDVVVAVAPGAARVAARALDRVLEEMAAMGFAVGPRAVRRPDGVTVPLGRADPMGMLALLIQEDVCVMARGPDGLHRLVAGALLFPSTWSLREKLGRHLPSIHAPIDAYDDALARRVQRLFDGLDPARPLERSNHLPYEDPALFQPRTEGDRRDRAAGKPWLRRERQVLMGLGPGRGGPALFTIRTYVGAAHG